MTTTTGTDLKATIAAELGRARARTLALLDVPADVQRAQIDRLMSPLVWDLAHIGNYEELWLLRALDGRDPIDPRLDDLYNAFEHPRWTRPSLPILGPEEARQYDAAVRDEVLALLEHVDLDAADPLRRDGFVYGMVVQHEHQHDETLLATHQLRGELATGVPGSRPAAWDPRPIVTDMVLVEGGPFEMGTTPGAEPWAYDNEKPSHVVELDAFWIDTTPVTNRAHLAFLLDGGYDDPRLWSAEGWAWRVEADLVAPQYWRPEGEGSWSVLRFGRRIDLPLDEPVQHVCFHEAEAHARWAGKRLPTEAEWEKAATWHPTEGKRRWPWGHDAPSAATANLSARHDGPAPVGSLPAGTGPWGTQQMIGDVWEWTSSTFTPHPGFVAFPYAEYSEVFWGPEHRVLRGGSWAADAVAVRGTFRNWDLPIRRQIFSGFRAARDA